MPLYEYSCDRCGDVFEVLQKFSDDPLTVHEKCGGPVHRLLSPPALQFKGSGWYVTDYARGSAGANGKSGEKSEAKTSTDTGTSEKSAESKTAAKPPAADTSAKS